MAYSFRRIFFIGHNLNHVRNQYSFIFFPWTFDLLLISSSRYLLFGYLSQKYYIWIQPPKGTNHEIKASIFTCLFHEIKTNIFTWFKVYKVNNSLWTTFFFQFHIFRSNRLQTIFKIGALKDFAIFWIKKKLKQRRFSASLLIFWQLFYRTPPVADSVFFKSN